MRKILVATDGSECALMAVKSAVELVEHMPGTSITLISVAGLVPAWVETQIPSPDVHPVALSERAALSTAERSAAPLRERGITYQTMAAVGDPGTEICRVAKDGGYDLVIVGSHGKNALTRLFLGSVSTRVLHGAHCAVLVAK